MPKGINWNEQFYKLLRLSLGLTRLRDSQNL